MHQATPRHIQNYFPVVYLAKFELPNLHCKRKVALPKILDILYSKFWAATKGFNNFLPPSIMAWISPWKKRHWTRRKLNKEYEIATTATAEVRIIIECFPQVVDRLVTGFSTSIEEDTHFRLILLNRISTVFKKKTRSKKMTLIIFPIALKSQRCELIFFWFFALRTRMIWTGKRLLASLGWGRTSCGVASMESWVVY